MQCKVSDLLRQVMELRHTEEFRSRKISNGMEYLMLDKKGAVRKECARAYADWHQNSYVATRSAALDSPTVMNCLKLLHTDDIWTGKPGEVRTELLRGVIQWFEDRGM